MILLFLNGFYLLRIHLDTFGINYIPKEFDFILKEGAFLRVSIQFTLAQVLYNLFKILDMLFFTSQINQDIIQVDNTEIINIALQSIINIALKGRWSISQAYWHNQELIVAIAGLKGSFLLISFLYLDLIVSVKKVEFAEDLSTIEAIKQFTNQQNRVAIFHCDGIKTLIVYTKL